MPIHCPNCGVLAASDNDELIKELAKALEDLSFECFAIFHTVAPSVETYNRTFEVLKKVREIGLKPKP
jgi:hypothetical protein